MTDDEKKLAERLNERADFWAKYWSGRGLDDPDSGPLREAANTITRQADEREEWQGIASAPKDGTRFLTFDDHYGVRIGRAFIRSDHDDWLSYVDCNGNSSKGGIRATHWRPLPAPPHREGKP